MRSLPKFDDPNLLIGAEDFSDAGVYRLRDDLLIVQSLDFFPPLVDDPFLFGQIAAANALGDIYAMGARPTTVLNIVGFPDDRLELDILSEILRGGAERIQLAEWCHYMKFSERGDSVIVRNKVGRTYSLPLAQGK